MGGSTTTPTPRRPDPQPRHRAFTTRSLGGHTIRQSSYALASGGGFGLREGEDDDDDGLGLGTREDEESPHFCCVVCHPDRCANRVNRYACGVTPDRYFILFYLHYNLLSHLFLLGKKCALRLYTARPRTSSHVPRGSRHPASTRYVALPSCVFSSVKVVPWAPKPPVSAASCRVLVRRRVHRTFEVPALCLPSPVPRLPSA